MAKLKYRKGSEIFEIFDTDDIKALQTKVDEVPRLPTFGSTSGNWPFGVVYWNVSADKKRLSLHGNIYFDSCGDAWSAMKAIPGGASNEWGLQVATPLGAQSKALWIPAVGFSTTNSTISAQNFGRLTMKIGTDGYCYVFPTTTKPEGDGPFSCFIVGRPGDEHIRHGLLPRGRSLEVALTFRAPPHCYAFPKHSEGRGNGEAEVQGHGRRGRAS